MCRLEAGFVLGCVLGRVLDQPCSCVKEGLRLCVQLWWLCWSGVVDSGLHARCRAQHTTHADTETCVWFGFFGIQGLARASFGVHGQGD